MGEEGACVIEEEGARGHVVGPPNSSQLIGGQLLLDALGNIEPHVYFLGGSLFAFAQQEAFLLFAIIIPHHIIISALYLSPSLFLLSVV